MANVLSQIIIYEKISGRGDVGMATVLATSAGSHWTLQASRLDLQPPLSVAVFPAPRTHSPRSQGPTLTWARYALYRKTSLSTSRSGLDSCGSKVKA